MNSAPTKDLDALDASKANHCTTQPELSNSLVYSEPRNDAYDSNWFGIAICLIGMATLVAAALIAHAEAAL